MLHKTHFLLILFLLLTLLACTSNTPSTTPIRETELTAAATATEPPRTPTPPVSPTPQPIPTSATYGPDEFPAGFNPMTGQLVSDPARLEYPAILLSISHFPPAARPQAGFSFAPWVYEYYITEGSTRHLAVIYGEFPKPEIPLHGECAIRSEPMLQTHRMLGNRVWHDENRNGVQDPREGGLGGICVNLLDIHGNRIDQTTTDSNGYFAFDVQAGRYIIEVEKSSWLEFAQKNVGDEANDSDVDPASGRTDAVDITSTSRLFWDAGLVQSFTIVPTTDPSITLPLAEVGPIRSGRIFYKYMGAMYQDSCLIYASADPDVLAQIPGCATVAHTIKGGGAMLALERMARISEQNKNFNPNFNYTSNLFSDEPPAGGTPALELHEYWALLNQSQWTYDAASEAWWHYVDESDPETTGMLHADVDRLNGRQLHFENIILMFVKHNVLTPTIVDIDVSPGNIGKAYLFRDGQMYPIQWSTVATPYEQKTGRGQPIRFINPDGTPATLKPGKTWVIIFGLESRLDDLSGGIFRARFVAPEGAKAR